MNHKAKSKNKQSLVGWMTSLIKPEICMKEAKFIVAYKDRPKGIDGEYHKKVRITIEEI